MNNDIVTSESETRNTECQSKDFPEKENLDHEKQENIDLEEHKIINVKEQENLDNNSSSSDAVKDNSSLSFSEKNDQEKEQTRVLENNSNSFQETQTCPATLENRIENTVVQDNSCNSSVLENKNEDPIQDKILFEKEETKNIIPEKLSYRELKNLRNTIEFHDYCKIVFQKHINVIDLKKSIDSIGLKELAILENRLEKGDFNDIIKKDITENIIKIIKENVNFINSLESIKTNTNIILALVCPREVQRQLIVIGTILTYIGYVYITKSFSNINLTLFPPENHPNFIYSNTPEHIEHLLKEFWKAVENSKDIATPPKNNNNASNK